MREWFLDNQVRLMGVIAALCVLATLIARGGWPLILVFSLASICLAALGGYLFSNETEWVEWSWSQLFLNILGGALMLMGWVILLRGVVALTVATVLLAAG
jgi:hypothetical protein